MDNTTAPVCGFTAAASVVGHRHDMADTEMSSAGRSPPNSSENTMSLTFETLHLDQRRHFRAPHSSSHVCRRHSRTASPASAGWRYGSGWGVGAGVAAGVVGGLALGAIASRNYPRPYLYEEPVYGDCTGSASGYGPSTAADRSPHRLRIERLSDNWRGSHHPAAPASQSGAVEQFLDAAVSARFAEPRGVGCLDGLHELARHDLGLAGMEIARVEEEMAALDFVVAHDDGRIACRQRGGEARRAVKPDSRQDVDLQPFERIVGRDRE